MEAEAEMEAVDGELKEGEAEAKEKLTAVASLHFSKNNLGKCGALHLVLLKAWKEAWKQKRKRKW